MAGASHGEEKEIPFLNPGIVLFMLYISLDLLLHARGADIFSITFLVFWLSSLLSSPGATVSTTVLIESGLHTSNSG